MLRSVNDLRGYTINATDGDIGTVHDFYFDDEAWAVRYLVVDTGKWLPGRQVLITPIAVREPDWVTRRLHLSVSRERVKNSPAVDTAQPVSRQKEAEYFEYYGYPAYWSGDAVWGPGAYAIGGPLPPAVAATTPPPAGQQPPSSDENHLRSAREVIGYHLQATDGELGHVEDFLVDDLDWAIRYVMVDTSNWWFGRKVIVPPEWMSGVDWAARQVGVDVTRESVKSAPAYDSLLHINRQWEADYYAHHKRPPYWLSEKRARAIQSRHEKPPVIRS